MDNNERMIIWCRMWSEDPALAYDLMTDSCRQWSGQSAGLDGVLGPQQQERFVTGYRAEHINVFQPRLLVDGGDRFGYLWDVTLPDGDVHTGLDVNILRAGKVEQNWTFVAPLRCLRPDPTAAIPQATDASVLERLTNEWLLACNGETDRLPTLLTEDFQIFTGAGTVDRAGAIRFLDHRRTSQPALRITSHHKPILDPRAGRVILLRANRTGSDEAGGLDLLTVRDGRIAAAWSLTGTRPFRY